MARAASKLRDAVQLLGQAADPIIESIKERPERFMGDSSPLKRALAAAVVTLAKERKLTIQRQMEAAAVLEREKRLTARRDEERQMFEKMVAESADVVKLNVGGVEISTSRATLLAAPESSSLEVLFSGRHGQPPSPAFIDADPTAFAFVMGYLRAVKRGVPSKTAAENLGVPEDLKVTVMATARQFEIVKLAEALQPPPPPPTPPAPPTIGDIMKSGVPFEWVSSKSRNLRDAIIQHSLNEYVPFGEPVVTSSTEQLQLMVMTDYKADERLHCKTCKLSFTARTNHSTACVQRHSGRLTDLHEGGDRLKWTCCGKQVKVDNSKPPNIDEFCGDPQAHRSQDMWESKVSTVQRRSTAKGGIKYVC